MKTRALLAGLFIAGLSQGVLAKDSYHYQCTYGTQTRVVEVFFLQSDSPVPCEVNYIKGDAPGVTLWDARYTVGFCEEKAEEFVKRQEAWGFSCKRVEGSHTPEDHSEAVAPL